MEYTPEEVSSLEPNQVFVFGSNADGFHGGGAAGYAMRGRTDNWRYDEKFNECVNNGRNAPIESRRGRWAVYGVGYGLQHGVEGSSWGIVTTQRPGYCGYVTIEHIYTQFRDLIEYAYQHPETEFLITRMGLSRQFGGLSWFTIEEMQGVFIRLQAERAIPSNIVLPKEFDPRIS